MELQQFPAVEKALRVVFTIDNLDELVKSPKSLFSVIPAQAGIQSFQGLLDSRLRGSDGSWDFLRLRQS
jgi:hypothetical protein